MRAGVPRVPADLVLVGRAAWVCTLDVGIPLAIGYVVFLPRGVAGE